MKKLFLILSIAISYQLLAISSFADDPLPPVATSIFSTSVDWESVTGLRMAEFRASFLRDRTMGQTGLELYFLDGFPCFAQSETAFAWISPTNSMSPQRESSITMYLNCVRAPETVQFAWREARRNASQNTTTGIMTCPVKSSGRTLTIQLPDCVKGKNWNE